MSAASPISLLPRVARGYIVLRGDARAEELSAVPAWPLDVVLGGAQFVRLAVVDPRGRRAWLYVDSAEAADVAAVFQRLEGFTRTGAYGDE